MAEVLEAPSSPTITQGPHFQCRPDGQRINPVCTYEGLGGGAERQRATFAWSPFCPPPPSTNPGTRSLDTNFNLWRVVYGEGETG